MAKDLFFLPHRKQFMIQYTFQNWKCHKYNTNIKLEFSSHKKNVINNNRV